MHRGIFERRPIAGLVKQAEDDHRLLRLLDLKSLTCLGVGGLIGTGIFVMIGIAARNMAGPAIIVSFLVAAVACVSVALCFCELASRIPAGGTAYAYASATLGHLPAWLVGWNLILCYLLATASVAQGWSHYFQSFLQALGISWPAAIGFPLIGEAPPGVPPFRVDLAALLIAVVIASVIIRGIRISLRFNNVILLVKLAVILFVIVVGALHVDPRNWSTFAPFGYGGLQIGADSARAAGMLAAAALVFYAYFGFEVLSIYTEECKRPRRDIPLGILYSVAICTVLYVAVAAVLTGMVRYDRISPEAPVSEAFRQVGLPFAQFLVAGGALAGITSVVLIIMMSLPRILAPMARDGLLPEAFDDIDPQSHTPARAIVIMAVVAGPMASLLPLQILANFVAVAQISGYVLVCVMAIAMRLRKDSGEPSFQAPLGVLFPLLGIVVCTILLASLPTINWLWLGGWACAGLVLYFAYCRKNSRFDIESHGERDEAEPPSQTADQLPGIPVPETSIYGRTDRPQPGNPFASDAPQR